MEVMVMGRKTSGLKTPLGWGVQSLSRRAFRPSGLVALFGFSLSHSILSDGCGCSCRDIFASHHIPFCHPLYQSYRKFGLTHQQNTDWRLEECHIAYWFCPLVYLDPPRLVLCCHWNIYFLLFSCTQFLPWIYSLSAVSFFPAFHSDIFSIA